MKKKYIIKAFYADFFSDILISYVCLRLSYYFNFNIETKSMAMGLCSDSSVNKFRKSHIYIDKLNHKEHMVPRIYFDAIPRHLLWPLLNRLLNQNQIKRLAEFRYFKSIKRNDIAYLWPEASLNLYKKLRSKGCLIVSERINTLRCNSKEILDNECKSLNLPISHGISDISAKEENECMNLSDFIFSPSPAVKDSLISAGVSEKKILNTSYGLKHEEIIQPKEKNPEKEKTAIFVGTICVRKGIHLLLDAWQKADVNAKLKIVGKIDPQIKELFRSYLAKNPNIEHIDFVKDLKPIYQDADFFILPSLEEGSPLVTYLALGASLPVIVSPMGSGGIIEDGKDGIIIDPHDQEKFISSIRNLISDDSLRLRMAEAAGKKAIEYTWDRISKKRIEMLIRRISNNKDVSE